MVRDRPVGGKPTALAVCDSLLAVGTVRGLAVLFDRQRNGRLVQFMNNDSGDFPVAALAFSANAAKLAVAYSNGAVKVFKCGSGKLVDAQESPVQPGHGILLVQYVSK